MTNRLTDEQIEAVKDRLFVEAMTEDSDLATKALTAIRQLQNELQGGGNAKAD